MDDYFSQAILDAIPVPIFFKNTQAKYLGCNLAFLNALGVKKEDVVGKTPFDVAPPALAQKYLAMDMDLFEHPGQQVYETLVKYSDGMFHNILFHKATFCDKDGNVIGLVGVMFDITKRKQDESELKECYINHLNTTQQLERTLQELTTTQQQLIQQERLHALEGMASGIAHDFNNSLTPIIGFSDLLLNVAGYLQDQERSREYLKRIKMAAVDAGNIVKRLRCFYRQRSNNEPLQQIRIDKIIEEVIFLTEPKWKSQPELVGKKITVVTKLDEIPDFLSNPSELREVLTNLLFNAVDAMPNGGTISISTRKKDDWVVLEVSDTGIGMSEITKRHCLEPFFTTKGEKGSGLGLSVVYGIIQRHHGHLEIQSIPKQGTTFSVYLPIKGVQSSEHGQFSLQSNPLHILLIDDDPKICEILQAYLEVDKHILEICNDPKEAMQILKNNAFFNVVICEYAMKEMSGETLAGEIKKFSPNLPVIMVTGFSETIVVSSIPYIDVLLQRPLSLNQLRQALQTAVFKKPTIFSSANEPENH